MTFVPDFSLDVLVASLVAGGAADAPGLELQWQKKLVELLKDKLRRRLNDDAISINSCLELPGEASRAAVTAAVPPARRLSNGDAGGSRPSEQRGAAALVVVLSPGFAPSDWQSPERSDLLDAVRQRTLSGLPVFLLERGRAAAEGRPSALDEVIPLPMWITDDKAKGSGGPQFRPIRTNENYFFEGVVELAVRLADSLKRLKTAALSPPAPPVPPGPPDTIAAPPVNGAGPTGNGAGTPDGGAAVFISHSQRPADDEYIQLLNTMLAPLVRGRSVRVWDRTQIEAGKEREREITKALKSARVAVLLASADFFNQDDIVNHELPYLLEAAEARNVQILWVLLRDCLWDVTPLAAYQAAHDVQTPLSWHKNKGRLDEELAAVCRKIKAAVEATTPRRGLVFLAQVTANLVARRRELKKFLENIGWDVRPEEDCPGDPETFRKDVRCHLATCRLFVQLLDEDPGTRPALHPLLQHQWAVELRKPVMQRRRKDLDIAVVRDASHRELLQKDTVLPVGLLEFEQAVQDYLEQPVRRVRAKPAKKASAVPDAGLTGRAESSPDSPTGHDLSATLPKFVFVSTEPGDRDQGKQISAALVHAAKERHACRVECLLPLERDPAKARSEFERYVRDCDGLVVVYGESDPSWVQSQILQVRKAVVNLRDNKPLDAVAVYEAPPPAKDDLQLSFQVMSLRCREQVVDAELDRFVRALGAADGGTP